MRINEIIIESYQLDEGLGDWIEKKMDQLLGNHRPENDDWMHPSIRDHRAKDRAAMVAKAMSKAPPNLPDDVAEKLVADFMKKAEARRLAQQAAEAQKTTVEKIVPYLTYFARKFKERWEQIPQRDRQNALKNLAHNILNLLLFILKAMVSSKK